MVVAENIKYNNYHNCIDYVFHVFKLVSDSLVESPAGQECEETVKKAVFFFFFFFCT